VDLNLNKLPLQAKAPIRSSIAPQPGLRLSGWAEPSQKCPQAPQGFPHSCPQDACQLAAILSSWGIKGNAGGKAFLIIVNAAKHSDDACAQTHVLSEF
jgi:hypothetical protein